ncbi:MAG: IPTL-CTERM sorting domain-containing protein [Burkholderiaceae bacterium]|nr:IPTL-CTERM sorting domain-containing protein [Burkholderiaceae bacterium]
MSIAWPRPVGNLIKWGVASTGAAPSYFAPEGLNVSGNTSTFTVTDGQKGDDDWVVNGTIVDPVGPIVSTEVAPIPALGPWALALLGLLAAGFGLGGLRRRPA